MRPILLHHQVQPFFYSHDGTRWVQCWIPSDLEHRGVFLRQEPDNEERLTPMTESGRNGDFSVFQAPLIIDTANAAGVYAFKILCDGHQWWLDAAGVSPRMPLRERFFRWLPTDTPPDWMPDQIFYQLFPERFRNGDPGVSPPDGAYQMRDEGPIRAKRWGQPIDPERPNSEFYGGDLIGIREKLGYLADLGVTALYLNPVFTSPSVHKYDCEDFEHVDPYLGGDQALADLRAATQERGMRLMLDAVFNHCSDTHPWFNRWGTHARPGAYQDPHHPYRDAFIFANHEDPESYACWMGSKVIPTLDYSSHQVQEYFYAGEDAIVRRWLRPPYQIDGWRFDVIHMLGEGTGAVNNTKHIKALRRATKEENLDACILGEHFFEASRWLQGGQEDAAMNYYGFSHPVRAFLAAQDVNYHPIRIDAIELDRWLTDARSRIPYQTQLCQLNLLGSHDTTRFLTLLDGDQDLMHLALLVQFSYPGVPCIYYGDEIGMIGENDPYNRACFDWDEGHWNRDLRDLTRRLARIRGQRTELRRGAYQTLIANGDLFAFARFDAQGQCIVVINRGDEPVSGLEIALDQLPVFSGSAPTVEDALSGALYQVNDGRIRLDLGAKSGALLLGSTE